MMTRVPHQLTGVCDCPEHRRSPSATPRVLLVVIVLAVAAIAFLLTTPSWGATLEDSQRRWSAAHPSGVAPRSSTAATSCVGLYHPTCDRATRFHDWAHPTAYGTVTIDRRLPGLPTAARWCLHVKATPDPGAEVIWYIPFCDAERYVEPVCLGKFEAAYSCTFQGTASEWDDYTDFLLTTQAGCRLPQPTPSECAVFQAPLPFADGFESSLWRIHT